MQIRVERNQLKQRCAYQRADYQAWKHLDGEVEIIKEAERMGLRSLVIVISFEEYIEDLKFLKTLLRCYLQVVPAPGIGLTRLTYLATVHDEPVREVLEIEPENPKEEAKIIGKRTAIHIQIPDYILGLGLTLGMSIHGETYLRSLLFQQYANAKYGFRDPSYRVASSSHFEDETTLLEVEETDDGSKISRRFDFKKRIEENVQIEVEVASIQSRNDLIEYLLEYGPITYCNESQVTMFNKEQASRFAFKGGIFALKSHAEPIHGLPEEQPELSTQNNECDVQSSNSVEGIESTILDQFRINPVRAQNDLLKCLMNFSTIIYLSKHQIIIQPHHDTRQFNLYGGIFSEDGLKYYLQECGRTNSTKTGSALGDDTQNIFRYHSISERKQFHDGYHPSTAEELREKLETLYKSGKTHFRTRFENAECRLRNNLEALFDSRGLPSLDTFGLNNHFNPVPFPDFPAKPTGLCGYCDVPPIPRKDISKNNSTDQEQRTSGTGTGQGIQNHPNRTRSEEESGSRPGSMDKLPEHVSSKYTRKSQARPDNRGLEISKTTIKEYNERHDSTINRAGDIKGLQRLIQWLSRLRKNISQTRKRVTELRKRKQRIAAIAREIELRAKSYAKNDQDPRRFLQRDAHQAGPRNRTTEGSTQSNLDKINNSSSH
jgi:hypothetical protein